MSGSRALVRSHADAFPKPHPHDDRVAKRGKKNGRPFKPVKPAAEKKNGKIRIPPLASVTSKPWCYYCLRTFDDLAILLNHQKAKHFKCTHCSRRLNTAGGLRVHLDQVHKEPLKSIENATDGRDRVDIEIFGMEGVPEEDKREMTDKVIRDWNDKVLKLRQETGNGPPGSKPNPPKRVLEDPKELLKRLAGFKKKKAEELLHKQALEKAGGVQTGRADVEMAEAAPVASAGDVTTASATVPEAADAKKKSKIDFKFPGNNDLHPDMVFANMAKYFFDRQAADQENVVMGDVSGGYTGVVGGTNEAVDHEMTG